MFKKFFTLFMSMLLLMLAVPFTSYAANVTPIINLTVGSELVGTDASKWDQTETVLSYKGKGYTYYTDTENLESGRLVLDGTTLDSYYKFRYQGTEEGQTHEAPGVISTNFVRLAGDVQLQKIKNLDIVVNNPTTIKVKNHTNGLKNSYDTNNTVRCYGVYSYKEYGVEDYAAIKISGKQLSISGDEQLIAEVVSGVSAQELEIGENGKLCISGINARSENKENSWAIRLAGIDATEELTFSDNSSVEVFDLTSSAEKYASVEGIDGPETYIGEGATVNIGKLSATAHEGNPDAGIHAIGMNMYDDLENHGTINIGQGEDNKIVMDFSNDFEGEIIPFAAGAEGICCNACYLCNYGTIKVDNVVTNFSTNSVGGYDIRTKAYADGIYAQLGISNFPEAVMYSNQEDGIELNVNAPNNDDGSYFSYGILSTGTECTLLADDADVRGRAGKMNITAKDGGATAMGIFCTIIDSNDSVIKGMSNVANISSDLINNNQLAIACNALEAKGNSYIVGDSRESHAERRGDGIEITDEWSLSGNAVIEGFGANNNAITTDGRPLMPALGDGYAPKLEYGSDESHTNTVYVLEGEEYVQNAYAKISNEKITSAKMERVIANVGDNTLGIVVSGVKEGENFYISIEQDGEEIGTTEYITSNGTVTAYLQDGKVLEKGVSYVAKLYRFRDKEASRSDLVGYLKFDASEVPITGDSENIFFHGIVMIFALLGAGFVYGLRRKENR